MRYYFAPMEGLTDSVYRRLHRQYFPGVTAYYMPFFSPTVHRALTSREARELPPADSVSFAAVPQLLTKVPEDFLWMAGQCADLGYSQVDLNLGCPSGTVVAKGKGAGMLADLCRLQSFLDEIFARSPIPISVKTRLGLNSAEEFPPLLDILNQYPISMLTLHPRVRKDFYNGPVNKEAFRYCLEHSHAPVCYNGNLCSLEDVQAFSRAFPGIEAVMIGRGLIGDPGMLSPGGTTADALEAFYEALLEEYLIVFGGSRNAMFRLKENWRYLLCRFEGSERLGKRLRKTTDLEEYRTITREIFHTLPISGPLCPNW